jgi:CheY-like chemotaxis protein
MAKPLPPTSVSRKKRVLLVDTNAGMRKQRAAVLRKHSLDVTCASDLGDARLLWRHEWYNLVLIDAGEDSSGALELSREIKEERPGQLLAFLVGEPHYLAATPEPGADGLPHAPRVSGEMLKTLLTRSSQAPQQRGRFLEVASRILVLRRLVDPGHDPALAHDVLSAFGDAVQRAEASLETAR